MTFKQIEEGIYAQDSIFDEIKDIDGIIFDCDGVLVDVSNSYDLAIQRTTNYVLKEIANIQKFDPITSKIIDGFKATGGFNDEVDLTYASIISLAAANSLNKNGNQFIFDVIDNADQTGIISVEKFLEGLKVNIYELKKKLDYPGRHQENLLYTIFDQIFYGPKLYSKLFNKKSEFSERGFIESDIVIVTQDLLCKLKSLFDDKIAIVTGRGIESIRYSLKGLLDEFKIKQSMFLEDESRELAKPNPEALIRSIKRLESSHCLFVGDSMEDFLMAQKATQMGNRTTFCGIIGTSKDPIRKLNLFQKKNVSIVLGSIDKIPKALNLVSK
jgi:phosphoglycolate phosphatase-like HAD superfamily hydrolase